MRRSPVVVLIVALLLLGACGGDDKKDVSASKDEATTTTSEGSTPTTVDSGGATTSSPSPGSPKSGTSKKAGSPSGGGSASAAGPQQSTPAGVKAAAPGTYTYKVTGTSAVGSPTPQKVDTTSTLEIDALQGTDQHSAITTPQGGQENVLRYQGDGVHLVNLKFTGVISKEFKIEPPALAFPQPPTTVGRTWGWTATSTDGKTTVKSDFKILRTETIAIGGEQVPAVVVEAKVVTSGDLTSTSTRTIWTSEAYRLIVRQDEKISGKYGAFPFSADTSSVMQSTKPS